jgi:pyruvate formate lyase activating enzyme
MNNPSIPPLTPAERTRLEQVEGIIFDIQRYSVHDGPGLRTNVFLKGCPLRCGWCANPESQQMPPELALFEHNCMTCGQFESPCPTCWTAQNGAVLSQAQVTLFDERAAICPTGAMHWIGERRTAGSVMREVRRDIPFYEDGGGLTLTGGEATMQPDMAEALLRLAKAEVIATAIETCGHTRWAVLERLLPWLDDVLYDVKHVDSALHYRHTGLGSELILDNLRRLVAAGAPVTVRVPLIPGFNATPDSVRAICEFVRGLGGPVKGIDLLPYHTLGKSKYDALHRPYLWADYPRLTDAEVSALAQVAAESGLAVSVGG